MKLTNKAIQEQVDYTLSSNPAYQQAIAAEYEECERRFQRYGYWIDKSLPTKNMIKALRMHAWANTPQDWARLHVIEAAMRMK